MTGHGVRTLYHTQAVKQMDGFFIRGDGMEKRFYWLRLREEFFTDIRIKKLRSIAGGDTFTIIYQKLLLLSLEDAGRIYYEGVCASFEEELALRIDEDIVNIQMTVSFLKNHDLLIDDHGHYCYELPQTMTGAGSESDAAERMRKMRKNQKQKKLLETQKPQDIVVQCGKSTENTQQYVTSLQPCYKNVTLEKEIEKEIEKDKEKESGKSKRFSPPSIEEIQNYCNEKGYQVNAKKFHAFYDSKGWMVGKNKMTNWKSAAAGWNYRDNEKEPKHEGTEFNNFTSATEFFANLAKNEQV